MVQGTGGLRLQREPAKPLLVSGERQRENLYSDVAVEPYIACTVYLAHTAGANRRKKFVRTEAASGRNRHVDLSFTDCNLKRIPASGVLR